MKPFDIRQHIDKLTTSDKPNRYICPVCGDNNFTIANQGDPPAYQCWSNGCEPAAIRQAIAPLPQGQGTGYRPQGKPGKPRPSARERERAVQVDCARVEAKIDELIVMVAEGLCTQAEAQVTLGNWCQAEGFSRYDAGKLFQERSRELEGSAVGAPLSTADLVARIQAHDELESPTDRWEAWEALKADSGKTHRDLMELARATKIRPAESDDTWAMSAQAFGALDLGAREWLFESLLPANRTILLGADAKTGKSLLVYDWAYHLATGQSWGEFPCDRPRKVLIVQTDESEIDCQERLNVRGLNELDNVRIIRAFTPALMARLKRVAVDWGAEVIIFDSLTSIQRHSGYSPKDPEYGYWLYDLKDFASECRITPILVTHTNKAPIDLGLDKVAGSYSITAAVSEIFMVTRPADPANDCDRVLVRVGSRSAGQSAWMIQLNLEDFSWAYQFPCQRDGKPLEDDGSFSPDEKLSCRENVLQFLAHHSGRFHEARYGGREILGANYNNVRKICSDLRADGTITRRKSGRAWVYGCMMPVDPDTTNPSEKKSEKMAQTDHNHPQRHVEGGFQVDHLTDPPPSDGSVQGHPHDLPDLTDQELAALLGGNPDE